MPTNLQLSDVQVWTLSNCSACESAKQLLDEYGVSYETKSLDDPETKELFFMRFPNIRSVPQISIAGTRIGGLKELKKYIDDNTKTTEVV